MIGVQFEKFNISKYINILLLFNSIEYFILINKLFYEINIQRKILLGGG